MTTLSDTLMDSLHTPAVRDLAWVIGSPGLLDASYPEYIDRVVSDAWCRLQLQACAPWLAGLDIAPGSLHDFIAARPTRRLGHYFESLIAFWLNHTPGTKIIASNLQVQDADRTLGEFDFLFRDADAAVCHWEAAVKFYLQAEAVAEQRAFIGPGARDRLDLKLDRVFAHQLDLGTTPEGRAALPSGLTLNKAQAFIKGFLFFPATQAEKFSAPSTPIPGISGTHLSGWWTRHALGKLPHAARGSAWIMLPRLRWLSPVRLAAGAKVMERGELCAALDQHFATATEAVQVADLRRDAQGGWREVSRGFVVCSTWPVLT